MFTTNDPQLAESVKKMNHCCGPFARMRFETRQYAANLLAMHNANIVQFPRYDGADKIRKMIEILASDKAEFVKKELLKEYEDKKEA